MSYDCKFISLGKVNKYILLVFSAALFQEGLLYLFSYINFGSNYEKIIAWNYIILTLFYSLGLCLSFILFFIYKKCNKRKKNQTALPIFENIHSTSVEKAKSFSKLYKFLWILSISAIDIISIGLEYSLFGSIEMFFCPWSINILIMSLFSYFLLKIQLYKHHYFSIIISSISILLSIFLYFYYYYYYYSDNSFLIDNYFLIYFCNFICITLHCLSYVIFKYFMQKTYMKSYEILIFQGLIELVLSIIIIAILMSCGAIYNFQYFYNNIISEQVIYYFLLILLCFGYYSQLFIIIDIFSPYHIFLVIIITCIIEVLIEPSLYADNIIILIMIVACSFGLFFVLVFLEIIEINCYGLSYMTKKNIELRAKIDIAPNLIEDNESIDIDIPSGGYNIELEYKIEKELIFSDEDSLNENK